METNTNRYRSRILREMHQNTKNPFNSPPSSTGSHGTVTLTSDISLGPGAESMSRFESAKRATEDTDDQAMAFNINTSVLGRTFPEWANYKHSAPVHDLTEDLYDATTDMHRDDTKENIPPASSSTIASPSQIVDDQQRFLHSKTRDARERRDSLKAKSEAPAPTTPKKTTPKSRGANVTTLLDTLRTAQEKYGLRQSSREATPEEAVHTTQSSPRDRPSNAARSFLVPDLSIMNDFVSGTLRLSTLRNGVPIFVKNGKVHDREAAGPPAKHHAVEAVEVPQDEEEIFVSLDKIREEIGALQEHDAMVTEKAQNLEEEVEALWIQLHDPAGSLAKTQTKGSTEADQALIQQLKQDKNKLQDELDKANRKIKIVELRAEDSKAAKEAAERECDTAVRDRDRALQSAAQDARRCEQLENQLASAKRALADLQDENTQGLSKLESENLQLQQDNNDLRAEIHHLEHKGEKRSNELEKLKVVNQIMKDELISEKTKLHDKHQCTHTIKLELDRTAEDKAQLQRDVLQLEHVKQYFERVNVKLESDKDILVDDIKLLKKQVSSLQKTNAEQEQEIQGLQDDISTLQALLDEANNMTVDATDVHSRLESQKRVLEQKITSLESAVRRSRVKAATSEVLLEEAKERESRLEAANRKLTNDTADMQQQLSAAEAQLDFELELPSRDQVDNVVDGLQEGMRRFSGEHTKVLDRQETPLIAQFASLLNSEMKLVRKLQELVDRAHNSPDELETAQNTVTLTKVRELKSEVVSRLTKEYMARSAQAKAKPAKVTRIVSPVAETTKSYTAETTGRSVTSTTGLPLQDDFTREIDMDQPSPFASKMPSTQHTAQHQKTKASYEAVVESDDGMTGEPSQSLPPPFFADELRGNDILKSTEAGKSARHGIKAQPAGILKNKSTQFSLANDQDTGRFSVKSGVSGMSLLSNASVTNMFQRPTSATGHSDIHTREENMTSALFVDDITIDTRTKSSAAQRTRKISATPVLSKTAQRVLASLCDEHDCGNCNVCMRINSHSHKSKSEQELKQKIRVERPIAVTDRIPASAATSAEQYEDGPTIRPATNPAVALAAVMKGLKDEEQHIIAALNKVEKELKSLDASHGRRQRKTLKEEVQRLHRELDVKRDQIYMLHDVLEGQKASGEEMTGDFVEYTIHSIMGTEETWNGF
ncbi:hypothetical protein Micbo1qcDRAFT_236957 [Microdochium bolleyi]|uniref:Cep57 centrosome microtubule-binding domain-containing protein n=1 Tax=Microdochium bolleyi TaxID=196109 RepID=A0A136IMQ3_9PEZI|nr:hypothetical protein Micbo1qcDRAFT_236957 [Microdochium bolleyi]